MEKPKALDLFCGAGGATLGLMRAGFDVVGIDNIKRRGINYPGTFICADALNPPVDLNDFDLIWSSPPCQAFSLAGAAGMHGDLRKKHVNLIPETRKMLLDSDKAWVIENVPQAPIRADFVLTGPMFGLNRIIRTRHFECNFPPPVHDPIIEWACEPKDRVTITKNMSAKNMFYERKKAGLPGRLSAKEACECMGIDIEMTGKEAGEAIPPAYSEFIANAYHRAKLMGSIYKLPKSYE